MKRTLNLLFVFLTIFSVILGACQSASPATQKPDETQVSDEPTDVMREEVPDLGTIVVGYIPIIAHAPWFIAQERGYFAEQGLTVELQSFPTGEQMIAPLSLGQLDAGSGDIGPALINAIHQNLDVRAVMGSSIQSEGHGAVPLIVSTARYASGEITEVADLAGHKVAINTPHGMAEYLLAKALEGAGLTLDDVETVTLPFPEMPAALANGAIDAAILAHPLAASALRPGENDAPPIATLLLAGDQITKDPQNGAMYFGKRLLDPANKEVAIRLMTAYLKAARDLQGEAWRENPEILQAILAYVTVPEPAVKNAVVYESPANGEVNMASVEDIIAYHFANGNTDLTAIITADALFDFSLRDETIKRIGVYTP